MESTTAEVFESLDSELQRLKNLAKYQSIIFSSVVLIAVSVFVYLAYKTFVIEPKNEDASLLNSIKLNIILTLH